MSNTLGCPKCKNYSTPEFWDKTTKEQEGIDDGDTFMSSSVSVEEMQEIDPFYRCPICNAEVNGVDLMRGGKADGRDKTDLVIRG